MAENIIIEADDVWDYFRRHKAELRNEVHIIAENDEYGVSVSLTEEREYPLVTVYVDDYLYDEESALSKDDCTKVVEDLYDRYLTSNILTLDEEESAFTQEDAISEREIELDDAFISLLDSILEGGIDSVVEDADEVYEDIKDHVLEYIARKHKLPIYRPMMLEDEDGEEFFTEYPYECMIFDDEDNPVYK